MLQLPCNHQPPSLSLQDNDIDWGDGEGNGAQITVLEDGSEGEHGHNGTVGFQRAETAELPSLLTPLIPQNPRQLPVAPMP